MTNSHTSPSPTRHRRWNGLLLTLAIVIAGAILIWSQLPRVILSNDLSLIGQGTPAAVVVDPSFGGGHAAMQHLKVLQPEYEGRIHFLVAHLGDQQGLAFIRRYNVQDGVVLFLSGNGNVLDGIAQPRDVDELRHALNNLSPL